MGRRATSATGKGKGRRPRVSSSSADDAARLRDLEQRLAEALTQLEASRRGLTEALEQQTATSEILRVISRSRTDVQPVFDAIVRSAVRLLRGYTGMLVRIAGDQLELVALTATDAAGDAAVRGLYPRSLHSEGAHPRAIRELAPVNFSDVPTDPRLNEAQHTIARDVGFRSQIAVPLLRHGVAIGALSVTRSEPGGFADDEIGLLQTFADQAVIAIENARILSELQEGNRALTVALEQKTATSDILRAISSSPADVDPVFDAIVENAGRLCDAVYCVVYRFDGVLVHVAAHRNMNASILAALRSYYPRALDSVTAVGRSILDRRPFQVEDARGPQAPPASVGFAERLGYRTLLSVPMLREGLAIGAIALARRDARLFSEAELDLVETFADQAVIAIENVRLFTELQASNRDLTRALDTQTATSDILKVISVSPTDVQPVFDAIVRAAVQLCHAVQSNVQLFDGQLMHYVAGHNIGAEAMEVVHGLYPMPPNRSQTASRAVLDRAVIHVADVLEDPAYLREMALKGGWRSVLSVPMNGMDRPIGAITVTRMAPGRFSETEIALLQTFADQAVIAIENVRLFTELQASNRELTTALETQTATSDILRVISGSRTDAQPVFDAIVQSAVRLLGGHTSTLARIADDQIALVALTSTDPAADAALKSRFPQPLDSEEGHAQVIRARAPINIADATTDLRLPDVQRSSIRARGIRSLVLVPLLRQSEAIGALGVSRGEPGGFTADEIALLQTFADQAVIAIENARLLSELQSRTEELTRSVGELRALGEVGRAIGSTLDLETVLTTIVARATDLAGADAGVIYEYDAAREIFERRATERLEAEIVQALVAAPIRLGQGVTGRLESVRAPIQQAEIRTSGEQLPVRDALIEAGYRSLLAVPLLHEQRLVGGLTVFRRTPGEFAGNVVELLQTFATQSALAIQNARLFREIEIKSRELQVASQHKSEFLANMSHELRTPLNAIIGYSELLEEEAGDLDGGRLVPDLQKIAIAAKHQLSLINDILDLSKVEAGRMELEVAEFDLPTAIDDALTLVRERAVRRGIALGRTIDGAVGAIHADERKVKQVLLNLLSNALKFTPEGGRIDIRAVTDADMAQISVADTGVGIAAEDLEAVFEEFRQVGTADKKVEGTGLGLALCRKFVELHGGRISVKSRVGEGSSFTFTLPVRRDG